MSASIDASRARMRPAASATKRMRWFCPRPCADACNASSRSSIHRTGPPCRRARTPRRRTPGRSGSCRRTRRRPSARSRGRAAARRRARRRAGSAAAEGPGAISRRSDVRPHQARRGSPSLRSTCARAARCGATSRRLPRSSSTGAPSSRRDAMLDTPSKRWTEEDAATVGLRSASSASSWYRSLCGLVTT